MSEELTMPELTYGRYLRIPQLLALQVPSAAKVHDERLFITVHQVQELWFAQLLTELTDARDLMLHAQPRSARGRIARCLTIGRTLITSLQPLCTMPPREFHAFRRHLGTASGGESAQFREIEALSGGEWARNGHLPTHLNDEEQKRLLRRQTEPTLWDGLLTLMGKAGLPVDTTQERRASFARLAAQPWDGFDEHDMADLAELAASLLEHDAIWAEWRAAHTLLVERQIGGMTGTGGSTGVHFLRAGLHRRFFPELWEVGDLGTWAETTG